MRKTISYKWVVLILLCGAFFFHQADRALFGLLTIPIQDELGLTKVQIGWINTVLSWTLAFMACIAGPIGDRLSRKWLITLSLIFWSLMTICMGFVGTWTILGVTIPAFFVVMFFRSIATGGGESFYGPSAMALLASHHKETRSIALSIHQAALYVGLMSCGVMTSHALTFLGSWRKVFMAFGAAGLVLGLVFVFALRDGGGVKKVEMEVERVGGGGGGGNGGESVFSGVKYFFKTPSAICAMVGFIAIVFANNAYLFWAPTFMNLKFGSDVGLAGSQTMFWHHLSAFAAIMLGGFVTDRFVKRLPRFRLGFQILALLAGAPCLAAIGLAPSATTMIVCTAAYGLFRGFFEVNTHASLFDVIPARYRATSVGIFTIFAFFVGGLSGALMGTLAQHSGVRGFEIGFALMGLSYALAAATMMISFFFTFKKNRVQE